MTKVVRSVAILILITVVLAGIFFVWRYKNKKITQEPIPSPQVYATESPERSSPPPSPLATSYSMPSEINLDVPFTIQAPNANWDEIHKEFCEEASVLMAASYVQGLDIPDPAYADSKMFEIKTFEEQKFGYHKDTTAEETAQILREFYGIEEVKTLYDPTIENIKKALSEKKVIIVPAAGRQLGNPYFRQPGPIYHMLVVKGYTADGRFITNDPGTRRGADYIYNADIIMNAIHDWNDGDVDSGQKVVIIVG